GPQRVADQNGDHDRNEYGARVLQHQHGSNHGEDCERNVLNSDGRIDDDRRRFFRRPLRWGEWMRCAVEIVAAHLSQIVLGGRDTNWQLATSNWQLATGHRPPTPNEGH